MQNPNSAQSNVYLAVIQVDSSGAEEMNRAGSGKFIGAFKRFRE